MTASRFSLFYALYFALLGCIAPFWGLYLHHLEFSALDIGTLMALFGVVRILAPNVWAGQVHRFSGPLSMVRTAGLATLLTFSAVFIARDFWSVAAVMLAYGFFWAAMLPQYEVLCMQALNHEIDRYSRVRLWGSLGFIVSVLALGVAFEMVSVAWLPWVMWALMALIIVNALGMREQAHSAGKERARFRDVLMQMRRPAVFGFIVVNVLLQISFGPYYTFFSIFLKDAGYSAALTGILWALGVMAEVVLFWQFGRIMHWFSWRGWVVLSLVLTAVRWALTGPVMAHLWGLVLLQLLHAFSFAVMHAVSMRYVQSLFPTRLQGQGQALYSSVGFGLGGAIGAWISGLLWTPLGGTLVFVLGGLAALVAAVLAWWLLPQEDGQSRHLS